MSEPAKVRERIELAEQTISRWEARVREFSPSFPPMQASAADLEATPTAEITVSAEWLAAMLEMVNYLGVKGYGSP